MKEMCEILLPIICFSLNIILLNGFTIYNRTITSEQIIIEGDILVNRNKFQKFRNGLSDHTRRWPSGTVPYSFLNSDDFYDYEKTIIRQSMDYIEKNSCIKFMETNLVLRAENDILVITSGDGCYSFLGREGGEQELSLQSPVCLTKGTIIHELLHTLGFYHEQSRHDRDDYVEIVWQNIDSSQNYAEFDKYSDAVIDKYDYQSIMHYEFNAFSKSTELATIKPLKLGTLLADLGKAKKLGYLTDTDIIKLKKYYECK